MYPEIHHTTEGNKDKTNASLPHHLPAYFGLQLSYESSTEKYLVEPQSSGIGGGGFILYYDAKTKNIYAWDGREKAPMNFSEKVFLNSDGKKKGFIEAVSGGLAVGVPSLVTMLEKAHEVHGNMQWKLLFEDSNKLSTEGFVVGKRLSKLTSRAPHLKNQETAREYFNIDNGGLLEGTLKKNLQFADTLKFCLLYTSPSPRD